MTLSYLATKASFGIAGPSSRVDFLTPVFPRGAAEAPRVRWGSMFSVHPFPGSEPWRKVTLYTKEAFCVDQSRSLVNMYFQDEG